MNIRNKKKGFTIIELVIVIAVIGILSAILIPTFVGLVNKANKASDNVLVRDLNLVLVNDSQVNGKHTTMHEALEVTKEGGFDVSKINAKANSSEVLWDSVNDVFCYFDGEEIKYIPETTLAVEPSQVKAHEYFVIKDVNSSADLSTKYSTYLRSCSVDTLETSKGLDVGAVTTVTTINYTSTESNTVVIRTNGGTLVVNAPNGTVHHYGDAAVSNIEAVDANNSYHEFGKVDFTQIKKGHYVVEKSAKVSVVLSTGTSTEVKFDNKGGSVEKAYTTNASAGSNFTLVEGLSNNPTQDEVNQVVEQLKTGATMFAGGSGTEADPYLIENTKHLSTITSFYEKGFYWFKVVDGVDNMDCSECSSIKLNGNFDGNGVTFNNVFNTIFSTIKVDVNSTNKNGFIKNITINANITATKAIAVFGSIRGTDTFEGNFVFENVNVNGSITGAGAASYSTYIYVNSLTFKNCISTADVTTTSEGVGSAGFVIHTYHAEKAYLINSKYTGSLYHTVGRSGYWCDMSSTSKWFVDTESDADNGLYTIDLEKKGNKSGIPYVTVEEQTIDGVKFNVYSLNAQPSSTDVKITTWYTVVKAVKMYEGVTTTKITSTEMYTGSALSIEASENSSYCTVTLFVSPNDKNDEGGYLGAQYTEKALSKDGKWVSDDICNFIIKINGTETTKTGISADGKTFNIVNDFYGHTYGTAYVQFVEYDVNGKIITITEIKISNVNQ